MSNVDMDDWEARTAEVWGRINDLREDEEDEFVAAVEKLAAELGPDNPIGLFERGASLDSTGHSDLAVPLYERALALGLTGIRRRRAVIQMSSSLRNLGRSPEAVDFLTAEAAAGSDELDDAVAGFLALALTDVGREREAVSLALRALAPHLPRYQRSLANYGRLLVEPDEDEDGDKDGTA